MRSSFWLWSWARAARHCVHRGLRPWKSGFAQTRWPMRTRKNLAKPIAVGQRALAGDRVFEAQQYLRPYQAMLSSKLKFSSNTVIQRLGTLRFFYVNVLKKT